MNGTKILFLLLVPPSVMPEPSSGKIVVRKDTTVTLECKANGNPSPSVSWTKRSFSHHSSKRNDGQQGGGGGGENQQIHISKVTRLHKPGNFQIYIRVNRGE